MVHHTDQHESAEHIYQGTGQNIYRMYHFLRLTLPGQGHSVKVERERGKSQSRQIEPQEQDNCIELFCICGWHQGRQEIQRMESYDLSDIIAHSYREIIQWDGKIAVKDVLCTQAKILPHISEIHDILRHSVHLVHKRSAVPDKREKYKD